MAVVSPHSNKALAETPSSLVSPHAADVVEEDPFL